MFTSVSRNATRASGIAMLVAFAATSTGARAAPAISSVSGVVEADARVTVNGNVHTVETLIRGTPDTVRREVEEIFTQWGPDKRRLSVRMMQPVVRGSDAPEDAPTTKGSAIEFWK